MKTYIFEGIVTAKTSIAHNGGQSFGIESKLRREKYVQPNGTAEEVPIISGNGLRGLLRDRGMWHMCKMLGYGMDDESGSVDGLSLSAFYLLFSGGSLSSNAESGINIQQARELKDLIPLLGVFGGAVGNMIMPGKLRVGKMVPLCAETNNILPERFQNGYGSVWELTQNEFYTRKDDEKNEKLRSAIEPATRNLLDDGLSTNIEKAKVADAPQQMMYYVETLAAGTQFYWKLELDDVTDVEFEAFIITILEFNRRPYIGGKSAVGLGEVSIKFEDNWREINEIEITTKEVDLPLGKRYLDHLQQREKDIKQILAKV